MSRPLIACCFLLAYTFTLLGCTPPPSSLQAVIDRGELIVLTRLDPTTYYLNDSTPQGFEYELSTLFAESLGVKTRFIIAEQFHELVHLTPNDEADLVAAGLSITPEREKKLHFTPPYHEVSQQLVYHYRTRRPKSVNQLNSPFLR